jgi:nitronate monooxygenase
MPIETQVTRLFGIAAPILSAPMAGVAGGKLAAAVSMAGGLGLIGGGYGDRAFLEREFAAAGSARVGVGFITWALARTPDLLRFALDRGPAAIMLSFGDIAPFAPLVHRAGVPLIVQVQTVEGARVAAAEGAAAIVAQGREAGGHSGERSTMALVPAIVDTVAPVPVVAAGGIADGRGFAAALVLGAAGVLCGTAFFTAQEALSHPTAKQVAVSASGDQTVKGRVFDVIRGHDWPQPWTIRTLANDFHRTWEDRIGTLRRQRARRCPEFVEAQATGNATIAPVIVGEAIDLVRASEPARDTVYRLVSDAVDVLAKIRSQTNH